MNWIFKLWSVICSTLLSRSPMADADMKSYATIVECFKWLITSTFPGHRGTPYLHIVTVHSPSMLQTLEHRSIGYYNQQAPENANHRDRVAKELSCFKSDARYFGDLFGAIYRIRVMYTHGKPRSPLPALSDVSNFVSFDTTANLGRNSPASWIYVSEAQKSLGELMRETALQSFARS